MLERRVLYVLAMCGSIIFLNISLVRTPERVPMNMKADEFELLQTPHTPFNITHNSNFSDLGFPGSGTEGDPYIIEDILIEYDGICIYIANTTAHFEIRDSIFNGRYSIGNPWEIPVFYGSIQLRNVSHGSIQNCSLIDCYWGIRLESVNHTTIDRCTFQNNTLGISGLIVDSCTVSENQLVESGRGIGFGYCQNTSIVSNQIKNNRIIGIELAFRGFNCTIRDNVVVNNSILGVYLVSTEDVNIDGCRIEENGHQGSERSGGIYLLAAERTNITRNIIYNNSRAGIHTERDVDAFIYNNWISHNTAYGVFLAGNDGIIYGNAIGWNEIGNARDDGESNQWDDGVDTGNWWHDYSNAEDYEIAGAAGSADRYPMPLNRDSREIPIGNEQQDAMILILASVGVIAIITILLIVFRKRGMI